MAVGHADGRIAAVAAVVGEDEGRDPRQVGLERQHEQVGHEPQVLLIVGRDAERTGNLHPAAIDCGPGAVDPLLDLPHAGEVLIQLAAVGGAERLAWSRRASSPTKSRMLLRRRSARARSAPASLAGRAAEEPVEDQPGIDLLGDGRRLAPPREIGLVGAAIAVVAFAGVPAPFAADLQRGERGSPPDGLGGQLVDRDPGPEVGAVGLAGVAARQEAGHGPGVVAPAVAEGPRRVQGQPAQDQDLVLDRAQRLEDRRQLEASPMRRAASSRACGRRWGRRRTPMRNGGLPPRSADPARERSAIHGFQQRQGQRDAQALQGRPPRDPRRSFSWPASGRLAALERCALDDGQDQGREPVSVRASLATIRSTTRRSARSRPRPRA